MEHRKDIDKENMTLLEALFFSYLTGESFTVKRYSASAKNSVQYYVRNNKIFCQNEEQTAKQVTSLSPQRISDMYESYEGDYEQYHTIIKTDIEKFNRLKEEIEPLYSQFKEYERLKNKINCIDEDGFNELCNTHFKEKL